jgi:PAS domain S-box-containing protein
MDKKPLPDSRLARKPVRKNPGKEKSWLKKGGMSPQGSSDCYREIIENLQEVVFTTDLQGHFTYINPVIEQLTGYKMDQVLGGTFERFIYPDDFPGLKSSFKRTQGGLPESYEFRILHIDGKILHVHTSIRLIQADGKKVGLTGVMVEITDFKNNEQVLLEAEAKYHTLIDQIPAAVYTVAIDEPGSTLYISPQIEKLSGYTPDEWIADPALWDKIILPEDQKKVRAEHRKTKRTGKRFLGEYRLIARDGSVVWVRDEATQKASRFAGRG